jgi:hypothetical protein
MLCQTNRKLNDGGSKFEWMIRRLGVQRTLSRRGAGGLVVSAHHELAAVAHQSLVEFGDIGGRDRTTGYWEAAAR